MAETLPPRTTDTPKSSLATKVMVAALVFPLFIAIALPGIYLYAFHEPTPRGMNVAVIGTDTQSTQLATGLGVQMGDAFDVSSVATVDAARAQLDRLDLRGAYDPSTGTLYVASAGSALAAQAVETAFTSVAEASDLTLTVEDTHPLPNSDRVGVTLLFLALAAILAGFITATLVNLAMPGIRLWKELGIFAAMGVVAGVVTTSIGYGVYGALTSNLVEVAALVAFGTIVAALVQSGGVKLIGAAMTMVSLLLLVILGIPASGAAIPVDMTPPIFAHLQHLLPTSSLLDVLRRVLYFDGAGAAAGVSTLAAWAVLGGALIWLASLRKPHAAVPPVFADLLGGSGGHGASTPVDLTLPLPISEGTAPAHREEALASAAPGGPPAAAAPQTTTTGEVLPA